MHHRLWVLFFILLAWGEISADEKYLSNIIQLTDQNMSFEKAGEAYFSPDGNFIIFQAVPKGEDSYQMFVMNLHDRIPHMVSPGTGACTCGYFRPDGQKIIFASSHTNPCSVSPTALPGGKYKWDLTPYMNIYEANLDGSELVALTAGEAYHAECAYSHDGSQIVYASNGSGSMELYIINADGSNVRQITAANCYNGGPFFSPDSRSIIFRADREEPDHLQIYVIDVDGTNERQLTCNRAVNWAPFWHPEGKVIAYTTSLHGHHRYEIYLLNVETLAQVRLTDSSSFDGLPVFNKDGTKIMWTSKRGSEDVCHIFMADFTMPQELK